MEKRAKSAPSGLRVRLKVWIEDGSGEILLGEGKSELLRTIDELGSIAKAAQVCGIDYKRAWSHVKLIEEKVKDPLIVRHKGGKDGGGSHLTPKGRELLSAYECLHRELRAICDEKYERYFTHEGKPLISLENPTHDTP